MVDQEQHADGRAHAGARRDAAAPLQRAFEAFEALHQRADVGTALDGGQARAEFLDRAGDVEQQVGLQLLVAVDGGHGGGQLGQRARRIIRVQRQVHARHDGVCVILGMRERMQEGLLMTFIHSTMPPWRPLP